MTAVVMLETPIGRLAIRAGERGLERIGFVDAPVAEEGAGRARELAEQGRQELREYFDGARTRFHVPLAPEGTEFQKRVWERVRVVAWGQRTSYGAIARALGSEGLARAVGAAVAANPLPIIVPCHRVVAGDGKPTGYAWGIERKAWLLEHESGQARLLEAP